MAKRRTAVLLAGVGSMTTLVFMAGLAWACTNFLRIDAISAPAEATAARASTAVRGEGAPAGATVELRWNAVRGLVLARATAAADGTFSATMSVPDVAPGVYVLIARVGDNVARAAIDVNAGAISASPASPALYATDGGNNGGGLGAHAAELAVLAGGLVLLAAGAFVAMARRRPATAAAAAAGTGTADSVDGLQELVELGSR